ncbi:MAG: hypothetical protein WA704_12310, partial [Pseudolabrys sp.]
IITSEVEMSAIGGKADMAFFGAGFVDNLARPGGNATGFVLFEYGRVRNGSNFSKRLRPT